MKKTNIAFTKIVLIVLIGLSNLTKGQTFCNPKGNVILFSNYDGGILRINIDQDIPNINIGITSYEDDSVIISGTYAANVTRVIYAGFYNSSNKHCATNIYVKGVYGIDPSKVSIIFHPPSTLVSPKGNASIICNYECSTGNGQGCNSSDQIVDYFNTMFETQNSNVYFHRSQYGCWTTTADPLKTYKISGGGTCCLLSTKVVAELENVSVNENIVVQPNPSDGHIKLTGDLPYQYLKIYNTMGIVLFSKNTTEHNINEIDLSAQPKGIYFLEVFQNSKWYFNKIIIE
jgi:Secretion system C-terminal sorting domain